MIVLRKKNISDVNRLSFESQDENYFQYLNINMRPNPETNSMDSQENFHIKSEAKQLPGNSSTQECQTYDDDYEAKKKLKGFQTYAWLENAYNPTLNPQGFVNLGVSVNSVIPKTTLKYLPSYLRPKDCAYPDPHGFDQELNTKVSEGTCLKWNQTFTFNKIDVIVSLLSFYFKKIAILGDQNNFDLSAILDHSRSVKCDLGEADLIVVSCGSQQLINQIESSYENKVKLYILSSKQEIKFFQKVGENQVFTYQFELKSQIKLCAVHSTSKKIIDLINKDWNFFHPSNISKRASLTSDDLQIKIGDSSTEVIREMIKIDSGVEVKEENIWITCGAAGGLNSVSRALFNGGQLCTESPYYMRFDLDFAHSGVKMVHKSIKPQSHPLDRIKQAYLQGAVGYVVCNPNNPVGTKFPPEEIKEICEWAQDKSTFHIIFDEIYLNTCRTGQTMSAASYAIRYPNIHVIRGMAKDFGLCGFKIGITISSNPTVIQKLNFWKRIISHHPYTISVINQMLIKSNYGQEIIKYGKELLKQYFDKILKSLDEANIKYIKPEAGCFVFIDLRDYMKESSVECENSIWKKIFYKYRVNISCGSDFHAPEPGYYRVCPMTDTLILQEGLKRIKAALLKK